MNKRIIGGGIVAFLILVFVTVFFSSSAQAAEPCGTEAKQAVFQTVVTPGTDAVYKEVKVIDQAFIPATPGTPAVEEVSHIEHKLVTPEVPAIPAVPPTEEVSHIEHQLVTEAYDETVVDKEAWTEIIPGKWWNWSPNNSQGPQDYTPDFPSDERGTWQGPHTEGGPDGEGTFNVSHGNSGNSSWFHRDAAEVIEHEAETHVVHHDAVYKDVKVVDKEATPGSPEVPAVPAVYEDVKVVDVEAKPAVPGTPAVEEVSHMDKILVTPAVKEKSEQVLVSKAVAATDACVVPVVDNPPMTPALAYTGPVDIDPLLKWSAILFVTGLLVGAAGRRARNSA